MKIEIVPIKMKKEIQLNIPDDDMRDWIRVLTEAGFSEAEKDNFFVKLNETYNQAKMPEELRQRCRQIEEEFARDYQRKPSHEERVSIRKKIEDCCK